MKNSRQIFIFIMLFIALPCYALTAASGMNEQLHAFLETQQRGIAEKGFRSEYTIGNIDPRYNEKHCDIPLKFSLNRSPMNQANLTTLVECNDDKPWKLFITTTFNIYGQVVYAANTIARGHTIQHHDLQIKEEVINKFYYPGYNKVEDVVGMIAKRSIRQGSTIQANLLQAPKLVRRGDDVVIMASTQGIMIKMRGTAMQDGELGQQISVKNKQSERIIKAKVAESGLVNVVL